jgi:hypothetical protein
MVNGKCVAVVMPAHNPEKTPEKTVRELPDIVGIGILVDARSGHITAAMDEALRVQAVVHDGHYRYDRNQQTGYREELAAGADIDVMVHPDHQYTALALPPWRV